MATPTQPTVNIATPMRIKHGVWRLKWLMVHMPCIDKATQMTALMMSSGITMDAFIADTPHHLDAVSQGQLAPA